MSAMSSYQNLNATSRALPIICAAAISIAAATATVKEEGQPHFFIATNRFLDESIAGSFAHMPAAVSERMDQGALLTQFAMKLAEEQTQLPAELHAQVAERWHTLFD
jgi:hypothetical protein